MSMMKLVDEYTKYENNSNVVKGYMSCKFVSMCKLRQQFVEHDTCIEIILSSFVSTSQTRDLHNMCYFSPTKKMLYETYCLTYNLFSLHCLAFIADIDGKVSMKHAMHD